MQIVSRSVYMYRFDIICLRLTISQGEIRSDEPGALLHEAAAIPRLARRPCAEDMLVPDQQEGEKTGRNAAATDAGDPEMTANLPTATHTDLHDGWGELVLARPERKNALIGPMATELRAGLRDLLAGGARVVLLRGKDGAFCSGLDVDAFAAKPPPAWRATWAEDWAAFHRDLYRCPAVVIGALERFAINGGASLALACDLLVAGEGAYLLVGEAAIGMNAPMNVAWLRLRCSEAVAAQVCLAAGRVAAADLLRLGLAYKVVPDAAVAAEAEALAVKMAAFPGQGLAAIKAAMRAGSEAGEAVFDSVLRTGQPSLGPSRIKA